MVVRRVRTPNFLVLSETHITIPDRDMDGDWRKIIRSCIVINKNQIIDILVKISNSHLCL